MPGTKVFPPPNPKRNNYGIRLLPYPKHPSSTTILWVCFQKAKKTSIESPSGKIFENQCFRQRLSMVVLFLSSKYLYVRIWIIYLKTYYRIKIERKSKQLYVLVLSHIQLLKSCLKNDYISAIRQWQVAYISCVYNFFLRKPFSRV